VSCSVKDTATANGNAAGVAWRGVCFAGDAYLSVAAYDSDMSQVTPFRAAVVISSVSLVDSANPEAPKRLPLSGIWVASLFEEGVLRAQRLVQPESSPPGLVRVPPAPVSGQGSTTYEEAGLGADREGHCAEAELVDYPCPAGMYAYGAHAARLGGEDSWLDNLQLLCREELDVGVLGTGWYATESATGVAGDSRLRTRSLEDSAGVQTDVLKCAAKDSALMVGRVEPWRKQRILGLSLACSAWSSAERGTPWDENAVNGSLSPIGVDDALGAGTCTSNVSIEGSDLWATCTTLPNMRLCPEEPNFCCCAETYSYSEDQRRCEPCADANNTEMLSTDWRMCPAGRAVVGFRAATFSTGATESSGSQAQVAAVCAIELVCGTIRVRRYAGANIDPDNLVQYTVDEEQIETAAAEEEEGAGITDITNFDFVWYHYVIAGVAGTGLVVIIYKLLCRNQQQHITYGDTEGEDLTGLQLFTRAVAKPFVLLWKRVIKPLYLLFKQHVWLPFYWRVVIPAQEYIQDTRAYQVTVSVLKQMLTIFVWVMETFCPCVCWLWRRRHKAARIIQSLSPTSLARRWEHGDFSPRTLALELRRRIESGELSPRSLKAELAKKYARGELSPRTFKRRMEELARAVAGSPIKGRKKGGKQRSSRIRRLCSIWRCFPCCRRCCPAADIDHGDMLDELEDEEGEEGEGTKEKGEEDDKAASPKAALDEGTEDEEGSESESDDDEESESESDSEEESDEKDGKEETEEDEDTDSKAEEEGKTGS